MRLSFREWLAVSIAVGSLLVSLVRLASDDISSVEREARARFREDSEKFLADSIHPRSADAAAAVEAR